MRKLAVLSMHTSPLAQPGTGDGGGMNVYVRELSSALARRGVMCEAVSYTHLAWERTLRPEGQPRPQFGFLPWLAFFFFRSLRLTVRLDTSATV